MRNKLLPAAIILAIFAASFAAKRFLAKADPAALPELQECNRIVSMAPSITETLYALGLGDRIVGVTPHCKYPDEAKQKPKAGQYRKPNYEAVLSLRPDLVISLTGDERSLSALRDLGLNTMVICHNNVDGILASFVEIGRIADAMPKARRMAAGVKARLDRVRRKTTSLQRPRVLVVIQRTEASGKLQHAYVAGTDGFFDKMIAMAGGENAYPPTTVRFPTVSAEGIMWIDPDVIIDMTAGIVPSAGDPQTLVDAWQQVPEVTAVKTGRLYSLVADYAFVPGPRFILLVEELARLVHPEVDWEATDSGSHALQGKFVEFCSLRKVLSRGRIGRERREEGGEKEVGLSPLLPPLSSLFGFGCGFAAPSGNPVLGRSASEKPNL